MPHIIAVVNQKGGVAKTTTCAAVGAALAERGHETLVVDLDAQANLSRSLGVDPATLRRTVVDVLMGNHGVVAVSRNTDVPGLDLLPASAQLRMAERFLPAQASYEHTLAGALADARFYTFCLLDCSAALGPVTLNAIAAADTVLMPSQAEPFAVFGVRARLGLPPADCRVLVTLFDRRNRIHNATLADIRAEFGALVSPVVIEVDTHLRESQSVGAPITRYAPISRGALQYRRLARELLRRAAPPAAPPHFF